MSDISERIARLSPAKRALLALQTAKGSPAPPSEPIAVIGMACRYPGGVRDVASYWRLLSEGVDAIVEVPRSRWDVEAYYDPDPDAPGKMNTRWGGFVSEVEQFDAGFFGISPREAARMDPQQRLLLEVVWEALEHAGRAPDSLMGSATGVYVGISASDYSQLQLKHGDERELDGYFGTGSALSVASGRVSYVLGLQGPSVSVDTACSSSLVAVHLACQSLRGGECGLALAGGVSLMLSPEITVNFSKARMMSPQGRCKTFDAGADGYVRGEGCGVVVLKRLREAQRDGDPVLGVIRGTAVNQDGRSGGLTVPHGPSQEAVIREALERAGIEPGEVGYVEAHGTGTSLGDPIEVRALTSVLKAGRTQPLVVGSVKTNVGHLEAAAGIAGLMKVVLSLEHEEIPAHLHLKELNPHIETNGVELEIPRTRRAWRSGGRRRVGGVSSFGFSGTNAHVVLEEAPAVERPAQVHAERPCHVLCLSAKSAAALKELGRSYAAYLRSDAAADVGDVCFTAHVGRAHFAQRAYVVGGSAGDLARGLEELEASADTPLWGLRAGRGLAAGVPRVGFVFTDRAAGAPSLVAQLAQTQGGYRAAWQRCEESARTQGVVGLTSDGPQWAWRFAVAYAQAELWRAWGVSPAAAYGEGVGEYVAACVSGALSLERAWELCRAQAEEPRESWRRALEETDWQRPGLTWVSSWTGQVVEGAPSWGEAGQAGRATLAGLGLEAHLELGESARVVAPAGAPGPTAAGSEWELLLAGLGQLYARGAAIDWAAFDQAHVRRRVPLPTYPFQRERAWIDLTGHRARAPQSPAHSFRSATGDVFWEAALERDATAATLLDNVQTAAQEVLGSGPWQLEDLAFPAETQARASEAASLQVALHPLADGGATFQAFTRPAAEGRWEARVSGSLTRRARATVADVPASSRALQFGLMFFGGVEESWGPDKYRLVIEAARFADRHGFSSVWLPERHFVKLGALYPSPSILHAALARETRRIRLRAGSVVMPLHDPVRVAEEWAVVDNLSGGRIDISFASGWHPGDFIFFPERYADRHEQMYQGIETFRSLWRGEPVTRRGGDGAPVSVRIFPTPLQKDLPVWVTAAGNPRTFERAGAMGADLLTHLLDQGLEVLAERLALYREARRAAGHDPQAGRVTVMLHTFLGDDVDAVREEVRAPFSAYLRSIAPLLAGLAVSRNRTVDLDAVPEDERDAFVDFLFERFAATRALLGTPASCRALVAQLQAAGVDEVACLLDFGPPSERVLESLPHLDRLRREVQEQPGDARPVAASAPGAQPPAGDALRECFYELRWEAAPLSPRPGAGGGAWLIVGDGGGLAAALRQALAQRGEDCLECDAQGVVERLRGADARGCRGILDLRALDREGGALPLEDAAAACACAALELLQALLVAELPAPPRLWWVTRAAQVVSHGDTAPALEQSPLWGLGRTCAMEHPELWGGLVDLCPATGAPAQAARLLHALDSDETQVVLRAEQAYVARLVRVAAPTPRPPALAADAAYLVTGGLWGLGFDIARALVRRGARHVVLVGRTPLPPRESWDALEPGSRAARQTRAFVELEHLGARVEYARLDVGDERGVRALLEDLTRRGWPAIRGVVHAASVWQDAQGRPLVGPLARLGATAFREVFRPKVAGAWHLQRALDDAPLDFFVCFSSAAALLGSAGQGNYAAANAFLDTLAARRRARGQAGLSVNWGAVSESGFGATAEGLRVHEYWEARGIRRLTPAEVVDALERLLGGGRAVVGVLRLDWSLLRRSYPHLAGQRWLGAFLDEARGPAAAERVRPALAASAARVLQAAPEERPRLVEEYLLEAAAEVLALPPARLDRAGSLAAAGLDSLAALDLRNRIERELQVALPVVALLQQPSLDELSARLLALLDQARSTAASLPAAAAENEWEQGEL